MPEKYQLLRFVMAIMTLLEAQKVAQASGDTLTEAVVNEFLGSMILQTLTFRSAPTGTFEYNKIDKLPAVGFKGINEDTDGSIGVLNPQFEVVKILGEDLKIDTSLVDRQGTEIRAIHLQAMVQSARLKFEEAFFKGDQATDPREFSGLQTRVTGNQLISNNDAGGALSIAKLDEMVDQVKAPGSIRKQLCLNSAMKRRIETYYRGLGVSAFSEGVSVVGEPIQIYREAQVVQIEDGPTGSAILDFSETSPDGTSSTNNTSVYCYRPGPLLLTGIQTPSNGVDGIYVEDFGRISESDKYLTRVKWQVGIAIPNGRAVSRLYGIQNLAAVA